VIGGKVEGKIEMMGRQGRRRKQLLDDLKENRRGSTRSQTVENSLWKRLRTCRKIDCRMNEIPLAGFFLLFSSDYELF
jgi:hypothetical protein